MVTLGLQHHQFHDLVIADVINFPCLVMSWILIYRCFQPLQGRRLFKLYYSS